MVVIILGDRKDRIGRIILRDIGQNQGVGQFEVFELKVIILDEGADVFGFRNSLLLGGKAHIGKTRLYPIERGLICAKVDLASIADGLYGF